MGVHRPAAFTSTMTRSCSATQALLASSPEGATIYIDSDLRATATILEQAASILDFAQSVAVMLLGILQGIQDQDQPGAIVARLMDAVHRRHSYICHSRPCWQTWH
jgi:S-adenosyl methyltransferase